MLSLPFQPGTSHIWHLVGPRRNPPYGNGLLRGQPQQPEHYCCGPERDCPTFVLGHADDLLTSFGTSNQEGEHASA
jgi:hypothetical protein